MYRMQRNWFAPHPPIVIIGMHRSGTSMVTRMLESLGLFVGARKDSNCEARFFQRINRWLLDQTGSSWDNPQPIHYLVNNREVRAKTSDYIGRFLLKSPRAISFLGWRKYVRHPDVRKLDVPWGWKDPRNTFTLPSGWMCFQMPKSSIFVGPALMSSRASRIEAVRKPPVKTFIASFPSSIGSGRNGEDLFIA